MPKRYWLFKSEPDTFSYDTLVACPNSTSAWDGVRNYQARNLLRDEIAKGDGVLFYHSSCAVPGVAALAKVVREGYPDATQFEEGSKYYDPKSKPENPRWFVVDVKADKKLARLVPLSELRDTPGLEDMPLLRKGMRLSVQPVAEAEWDIIVGLAKRK